MSFIFLSFIHSLSLSYRLFFSCFFLFPFLRHLVFTTFSLFCFSLFSISINFSLPYPLFFFPSSTIYSYFSCFLSSITSFSLPFPSSAFPYFPFLFISLPHLTIYFLVSLSLSLSSALSSLSPSCILFSPSFLFLFSRHLCPADFHVAFSFPVFPPLISPPILLSHSLLLSFCFFAFLVLCLAFFSHFSFSFLCFHYVP